MLVKTVVCMRIVCLLIGAFVLARDFLFQEHYKTKQEPNVDKSISCAVQLSITRAATRENRLFLLFAYAKFQTSINLLWLYKQKTEFSFLSF